jgi:type I restriction enzyme, R subunit
MSKNDIGQQERLTQNRIVALFNDKKKLGHDYLGNWEERIGNRNIEADRLRAFLKEQGHDQNIIDRALFLFEREAGDTSKSLYDRNRVVYELLRYGVKVRPEVGANTQDVWPIDWKHPEKNHFAIAEEVTVSGASTGANTKRPDIVIYVNGIALVLELKLHCFGG